MTEQKKFYYVQNCDYGINISPSSLNGHAYSYYAFTSYKAREKWLDEHEFDRDSYNYVYAIITRKELQERIGKKFVVVKDYGLCDNKNNQVAYAVMGWDDPDAACCTTVYYSF